MLKCGWFGGFCVCFLLLGCFVLCSLFSSPFPSSIAVARGGDHRVELYKVSGCLCCPNSRIFADLKVKAVKRIINILGSLI